MDQVYLLLDFFLHIDRYLADITSAYGGWTYTILFLVIFCETGLVVTPFLPGDSLLFATGAIAATGALNIHMMFAVLLAAAVLGDAVNYHIGKRIGARAFDPAAWTSRFLKHEYLEKTQRFYNKYGGKTIIIARFVPIVRTFAPFLAGVGEMSYSRFALFNVTGGLLWTASFLYAGFFFGGLPKVKNNFGLVIVAIIVISVMPAVIEYWNSRRAAARAVSA